MRRPLHLLLLACLTLTAGAETIYLEGGTILRGKILRSDANEIVLEATLESGGSARMTIPRKRIRRIAPDGETAADLLAQGEKAFAADKLDEAAALARDAFKLQPGFQPARLLSARVLRRQGDLDGALRLLRQVTVLDRQNHLAWAELAHVYQALGQRNKAIQALFRAEGLASRLPVGKAYSKLLATWRRAAAAPPIQPGAKAARALFDRQLGNNAEAADAGAICKKQLVNITERIPRFRGDVYVELKAPASEAQHFAEGGEIDRYRKSVQVAQISALIEIRSWELMTNREKRTLLNAWVSYLKNRYPYATTIAVVADGRVLIAEAVWIDVLNFTRYHWHRKRDGIGGPTGR